MGCGRDSRRAARRRGGALERRHRLLRRARRGRGRRLAVLAGAGALVLPALVPSADAAPGSRQELTFADPAIDESSGLVVRGRRRAHGERLRRRPGGLRRRRRHRARRSGRTTYTTDAVVDVEALAPGRDGSVWVGDIGDNDRARPVVSLYRLPAVTRGDRTVTAQRFDLVHPDGPRDAETLLVQPSTGRVFVVTKGVFGGQVMAAPRTLRTDRPNRLRPVGTVGGLVTDGTFLPGGAVALRDYADGFVVDPRTWRTVGELPAAEPAAGRGDRAVAAAPVLVSSEGETQPLYSAPVPPRLLRLASPSADRRRGRAGEAGHGGGGRGRGRRLRRRGGASDGRRDAAGPGPTPTSPPSRSSRSGPAVAGGGALALVDPDRLLAAAPPRPPLTPR